MAQITVTGRRTNTITLEGSRVAGVRTDLSPQEAPCRGEAVTFVIEMDESISDWQTRFLLALNQETSDDPLLDLSSEDVDSQITVQNGTKMRIALTSDDSQAVPAGGAGPDKIWFEAWRTDPGFEARLAWGEIPLQPQSAYPPPESEE